MTGEWMQLSAIVAGVATAALLAIGPWVLMVHAKLAVLSASTMGVASTLADIDKKLDQLFDFHNEQGRRCVAHGETLAAMGQRVANGERRLRQIETKAAT